MLAPQLFGGGGLINLMPMGWLWTYFGSQWAIVKLKLILVTNISHSKRISCTDGGGNAIANATIPNNGGCDFLVCENVYCGRKRHNINTTCKYHTKIENVYIIILHAFEPFLTKMFLFEN